MVARAVMFSPWERDVLSQCIEKHKGTVENKKTDAIMIFKKRKAWELITKEFNSSSGVVQRDETQLKRHWEKQKALARKSAGQETQLSESNEPENVSALGEELVARVLSIQPSFTEEVAVPDSDESTTYSALSHLECKPLTEFINSPAVADCPLDSHCGISPEKDLEHGSFASAQSKIFQIPGDTITPQGPEPSSGRSERSAQKRVSEKIFHLQNALECRRRKLSGEQNKEDEVHVLRLSQHKELHSLKLKEELVFMKLKNEMVGERHAFSMQQSRELHGLSLRHFDRRLEREEELHLIEVQHQKQVNALKIKQEELKLQQEEVKLRLLEQQIRV